MDDKWFKEQQKRVGVTAEDIAQKMGRSRSNVSHIYTGKQRMSIEWAKAFAETLQVPIDEILMRSGALEETEARPIAPGFSDSDAAPWIGKPQEQRAVQNTASTFGGDRPGIDVWEVKTTAMILNGISPGDKLLIDTHLAERCKAGDIVIAQTYDWQTGTAETLLRRFEPPALVAASPDPEHQRIHIVDRKNIVIRGKVIASWRDYSPR